ncbi:hypothetical protein E2C01_080263 [Portunus trituberculatus]|uniref:Uncharacterized protein n=1 Tax=Portunus trituberculatus TaxID=210409 RepID=A0A5B7ISQ9_PORTR|nr:hypothetical protein [Portunus trituberculatus]
METVRFGLTGEHVPVLREGVLDSTPESCPLVQIVHEDPPAGSLVSLLGVQMIGSHLVSCLGFHHVFRVSVGGTTAV